MPVSMICSLAPEPTCTCRAGNLTQNYDAAEGVSKKRLACAITSVEHGAIANLDTFVTTILTVRVQRTRPTAIAKAAPSTPKAEKPPFSAPTQIAAMRKGPARAQKEKQRSPLMCSISHRCAAK